MDSLGTIAFIGTGKMATAIAGGLVNKGLSTDKIKGYDIYEPAVENFNAVTGASASADLEAAVKEADVVVLAVKPQVIASVLPEVAGYLKDKLVVSIAAGVRIETLSELAGTDRIIRVMPNTPALVGEGVSAYAVASGTTDTDVNTIEAVLGAIGRVVAVAEKQIDAVTGLSGSGPAYVFSFIQALADGGVHAGLARDVSLTLAAQTVLGAAKMVLETGEHPAVLSDQVTSPGGTTAEGLSILEKNAFKGTVAAAVKGATERSIELGKK